MNEETMTSSASPSEKNFPHAFWLSVRLSEIQEWIDKLDDRLRELIKKEKEYELNKPRWLA